jgi:hypothetical protein
MSLLRIHFSRSTNTDNIPRALLQLQRSLPKGTYSAHWGFKPKHECQQENPSALRKEGRTDRRTVLRNDRRERERERRERESAQGQQL